jgi:hypothetical protein
MYRLGDWDMIFEFLRRSDAMTPGPRPTAFNTLEDGGKSIEGVELSLSQRCFLGCLFFI